MNIICVYLANCWLSSFDRSVSGVILIPIKSLHFDSFFFFTLNFTAQRTYKPISFRASKKLQIEEEDAHGRNFQPLKATVETDLFLMNLL